MKLEILIDRFYYGFLWVPRASLTSSTRGCTDSRLVPIDIMTGWWVVHLQAPLLISRRANADDFGHSYEANESKPCPARLNLGLGLTWAIHSKRSERIKSKERFWRHKHIDHYALSQFHLKSYLATIGRWISPNKEMSYPQQKEKTRPKQNTRIRLCHSFYFQ